MRNRVDITGMKFNKLTVIYYDKDKHKWACKCDCGNEKIIYSYKHALEIGRTKSCGCVRKENASKLGIERHKTNTYDLSGEYGIGWTTNTNKEFYFDLEDYNKIKDYCWLENKYGYIFTANPKHMFMHRLILGILDNEDLVVDHIHHKTYDNRKSEIRACTRSQNMMNKTTKNKGIIWRPKLNLWEVNIGINNKQIYIGDYATYEEALSARIEAEEKYYGEYANKEEQNYDKQ